MTATTADTLRADVRLADGPVQQIRCALSPLQLRLLLAQGVADEATRASLAAPRLGKLLEHFGDSDDTVFEGYFKVLPDRAPLLAIDGVQTTVAAGAARHVVNQWQPAHATRRRVGRGERLHIDWRDGPTGGAPSSAPRITLIALSRAIWRRLRP